MTQKCLLLLLLLENGNPVFFRGTLLIFKCGQLTEEFFSKTLRGPRKIDRQTGLGPGFTGLWPLPARPLPPSQAGPSPAGTASHQLGPELTPLLTPASQPMNLLMGNKCLNQPHPTPTPKGQELLILTHHIQVASFMS